MYELPEIKTRKPKAAYRKPSDVKELEAMADAAVQLRYKNIEAKYLAPRKYRDDTANGLTQCIVTYCNLKGYFASRLNNMGVFRGGKYTRSTARRGLPDVLITKDAKSIFCECKIGRDRMSEHQEKVKAEQQQSGGIYITVRSYSDFIIQFESL